MALGVKGWVGLTLGFCVLLGAWLLPPRDWMSSGATWYERRGAHLPEVRHAWSVSETTQRVAALHQQRAWLDSLAPLVVREEDGIYLDPDDLTAEELAAREAHLREVVRPGSGGGAEVRLGVFVVDPRSGSGSRFAFRAVRPPHVFIGEEEGRPYCLVVDRNWPPGGSSVSRRLLRDRVERGPCALYARYGTPGPEIRAWLRETLHREARNAGELIREPGVEPPEHRRGLFGTRARGSRFSELPPRGERCLAGDAAACEAAVLEPAPSDWAGPFNTGSTPAWLQGELEEDYVNLRWYPPSLMDLGGEQSGLLFAVEEAFGPEAFARFWQSEQEVPDAFQAAFGQPLGPWVMAWARSWRGQLRLGPAVPLSTAGLSLLAVALCGALAVGFGLRRRVG